MRIKIALLKIGRSIGPAFIIGVLMIEGSFAASTEPCLAAGPPPLIPSIALEVVAGGFQNPVAIVRAGDRSDRLFIVEQQGTIQVLRIKKGRQSRRTFLDLRDRVVSGGELGLLGLAFHPNFSKNGRFFVNYTSLPGGLHTVISEFRLERRRQNMADPNTERILLTIPQPFANHNGGDLHFGPDGKLYIGTGDGGAANDPLNNAQNLSSLLGKMLRIDVDPPGFDPPPYGIPPDNPFVGQEGAAPEVWALGLRNPWRFSFDRVTGQLFLGDVGQGDREEIDLIEKGKNYGWNIMEGTICTPGVNPVCDPTGLELPILDYPRSEGFTVIGGYVYRGSSIPDLCGTYLYGDFGSGRIWGLRYDGRTVTEHRRLLETFRAVSAFGEDKDHELYLPDYFSGEVLKIVPPHNLR